MYKKSLDIGLLSKQFDFQGVYKPFLYTNLRLSLSPIAVERISYLWDTRNQPD